MATANARKTPQKLDLESIDPVQTIEVNGRQYVIDISPLLHPTGRTARVMTRMQSKAATALDALDFVDLLGVDSDDMLVEDIEGLFTGLSEVMDMSVGESAGSTR